MVEAQKVIFLHAKKEDAAKLAQMLSGLEQTEYLFFILPLDIKLITKADLEDMLQKMKEQ